MELVWRMCILPLVLAVTITGCIDSDSSSDDNQNGSSGDETQINEFNFAGQASDNEEVLNLSYNKDYTMSWDISHGELLSIRVRLADKPEYDSRDPKVFGCDDGLGNGDQCGTSTQCNYNENSKMSCDVAISDQENSVDVSHYLKTSDTAYLVMQASSFVVPFSYNDTKYIPVKIH